jgi:hypothetical protein
VAVIIELVAVIVELVAVIVELVAVIVELVAVAMDCLFLPLRIADTGVGARLCSFVSTCVH